MLVKIDEEGIQASFRVRAVFIANNHKARYHLGTSEYMTKIRGL